MKHIIAAITLLAASAMPTLAAEAAPAQQLTPTQEYRMWSAERLIDRLIVRVDKLAAACGQAKVEAYFPKASAACKESMIKLYPALNIIRVVAADGDDVRWAKVIDIAHKLESDTNMPLAVLEQAQ